MLLRIALAIFWFAIYAAFTAWVLFGLAPRESNVGQEQRDDDREPGELPLAA